MNNRRTTARIVYIVFCSYILYIHDGFIHRLFCCGTIGKSTVEHTCSDIHMPYCYLF